jgi:S1-C subfamily serine protease
MRIKDAVSEHTRQVKLIFGITIGVVVIAAGGLWWMEHKQLTEARAAIAVLTLGVDSLERRAAAQGQQAAGKTAALDSALANSQRTIKELANRLRSSPSTGNLTTLSSELAAAKQQQQGIERMAQLDYAAINRANAGGVAIIFVRMPNGEQFSGTAFNLTANGLMVTNKHLVRDANGKLPERIAITFNDRESVLRAHVASVSDESDLALLQIDDPGTYATVKGVVPSARSLQVGDPVSTIGFPFGQALAMEKKATNATFDAGTVSKTLSDRLQLTTYAAPGASGSPVFDRNGYVVGIVYGGPKEANGRIVYAVPSEMLIAALPAEARGVVK